MSHGMQFILHYLWLERSSLGYMDSQSSKIKMAFASASVRAEKEKK